MEELRGANWPLPFVFIRCQLCPYPGMGPILSLDISIVHIDHYNASKASCLL